jgi:hypothetical protein
MKQLITWLQMRLSALNNGKRLTWSLDDREAVSRLLYEIQKLEFKNKALIVIEHFAVHGDDENKEIALVYKAVHVANGHCLAPHDDWKEWVERSYADLIARGEHKPDNEIASKMQIAIERLDFQGK